MRIELKWSRMSNFSLFLLAFIALTHCNISHSHKNDVAKYCSLGTLEELDFIACFNFCNCTTNMTIVLCEQFDSFDQLNFLDPFQVAYANENLTQCLILMPDQKLTLNSSLNLNGLLFDSKVSIFIQELKSIDLSSNPFEMLNHEITNATLHLDFSDLFFDNANLANSSNIFTTFRYLNFYENVIYSQPIQASLFNQSNIYSMTVSNLSESNFFSIENSAEKVHSSVHTFHIIGSNITELCEDILSRLVFAKVQTILFEGSLSSIESSLFEQFELVENFTLSLKNFDEFIKFDQNKWMNSLNVKNSCNLILHLIDLSSLYEFPNEDFCLFSHFPYKRNVFVKIETKQDFNCSCPLSWLTQNWNYSDPQLITQLNTSLLYKCSNRTSDSCGFSSSLAKCRNETETTTNFFTEITFFSNSTQSFNVTSEMKRRDLEGFFMYSLIGLGVAFLLALTLSLVLLRKYQRLKRFKSDVAYELTTSANWEKHVDK